MSKLLKSLVAELTPSWMKKKDAAAKSGAVDSRVAADRAARRASTEKADPPAGKDERR